MIRVAVADDQPLIRAGLRMIVESQPDMELVGQAEDGTQVVALARSAAPDVILMDVRMPGMDGIAATAAVLADQPAVRILMLTTFDVDHAVYESMRAGASGFLLKDATPEQLLAGIRAVAGGDVLLAPGLTRRLVEQFVARPPLRPDPARLAVLTDREREVLVEMARGFSNTEIASRLYVSEGTVKTHVGRVLAKLGLRDRVHAVILAYEQGLVSPGQAPER